MIYNSMAYSQNENSIKDIDIELNKVFLGYKLDIDQKFTDHETGGIIYTISGIGKYSFGFEKNDQTRIEISILQENNNSNFTYVIMEIILPTENYTNNEKFELLNKYSQPPARVHLYWIENNKINLSLTDVFINKGETYSRLQDDIICLLGGLNSLGSKF